MSPTARAQVLHTFSYQYDGHYPQGGLTQDARGNLYGTTFSGSVYRLLPPSPGSIGWTEQILWGPQSRQDGANPVGDLLMSTNGALYGITSNPSTLNAYGTVYRLQPYFTANGTWKHLNLHVFHGPDGADPAGGLIADESGTLYGVTSIGGQFNKGTVFSLSPPPTPTTHWILQTLHSFSGAAGDSGTPVGRLVLDAAGNLYGATMGNAAAGGAPGIAYELSPSGGGSWTETILHVFSDQAQGTLPLAGLSLGSGGLLYGTASSGGTGASCLATCGVVFALTPPTAPGAAWQYQTIHDFSGKDGDTPEASLVFDAAGDLRGTTFYGGHVTDYCSYGCGVIFKLAPPPPGTTDWIETYQAPESSQHGANFAADLLITTDGLMYGTARNGGMPDGTGFGSVFQLPQ